MHQLSTQEYSKIKKILETNKDLFDFFRKELSKHKTSFLEDLPEKLNKKLFNEFLELKLKINLEKNKDKIDDFIKNQEISDEELLERFLKLNAFTLTLFIEEFINKLSKEKNITEKILLNLVEIINARNELQNVEMKYSIKEYTQFLKFKLQTTKL